MTMCSAHNINNIIMPKLTIYVAVQAWVGGERLKVLTLHHKDDILGSKLYYRNIGDFQLYTYLAARQFKTMKGSTPRAIDRGQEVNYPITPRSSSTHAHTVKVGHNSDYNTSA